MTPHGVVQTTINRLVQDDTLSRWLEAFFIDRKARGLSWHTIKYYRVELSKFFTYTESQVLTQIGEITPDILRRLLVYLEESGHNPGSVHATYRAIRAFLLWYESEAEPEGWHNPIRKVSAPRVPTEPICPVELDTVRVLIEQCKGKKITDYRDKALFLFLLDTGARASEVCALSLEDVDLVSGGVLIRAGKGHKPRTVYMGKDTRREVRAYLKQRTDRDAAMWATDDGNRLTYWGMNQILLRRAKQAGIPKPGLHDFRRAFAINFLRNSPSEIYSLQHLMGHADLQILRRYLKQTDADIADAHRRASPVDNWRQ